MALNEIDLNDPILTELEVVAFKTMLDKRESYVEQGRAREAHGAGTMIKILWDTLHDFVDTTPTDFGSLQ